VKAARESRFWKVQIEPETLPFPPHRIHSDIVHSPFFDSFFVFSAERK
jgi:hypothetical protein